MDLALFDYKKMSEMNEFLNDTSTWKNLCGLKPHAHLEHQKTPDNIYYWTERITFGLLLFNVDSLNQENIVVSKIKQSLIKCREFYHSMMKKISRNKKLKLILGEDNHLKVSVCLSAIFLNIQKYESFWNELKEEYQSFLLKKKLNSQLLTQKTVKKYKL
jgi:hypothetical protein